MLGFAVGDIVIVKGKGIKAFVEEIILTPRLQGITKRQREFGKYSLYALETDRPIEHQMNWYIGDHLGDDLEQTGLKMTKQSLLDYLNQHFTHPRVGPEKDIRIVIKNLGRTAGRNEE